MDAAKNKTISTSPLDLFPTTSGTSAKNTHPEFAPWLYSATENRTSPRERESPVIEQHTVESKRRSDRDRSNDNKPTPGGTRPQKNPSAPNAKSPARNSVNTSDNRIDHENQLEETNEETSESKSLSGDSTNEQSTIADKEETSETSDQFSTNELTVAFITVPNPQPLPDSINLSTDLENISPELQPLDVVLPEDINTNVLEIETESPVISPSNATTAVAPTISIEGSVADGLKTIVEVSSEAVVNQTPQLQMLHVDESATATTSQENISQNDTHEGDVAELSPSVELESVIASPVLPKKTHVTDETANASAQLTESVSDESVVEPTGVENALLQPSESKEEFTAEDDSHENAKEDVHSLSSGEHVEQQVVEVSLSMETTVQEQHPSILNDGKINDSQNYGVHATTGVSRGSRPWLQHAMGKESPATADSREIDIARFTNRIAKAFHMAQQREGEIRMRLHPPELGSLRIELQLQDGQLHARLQTESSEARTLILDNLPALKERLAEQNIRVEQFDVDLFDPTGQQPQQSGSEFSREDRSHLPRQKSANNSDVLGNESNVSPQNTNHLDAKNINVII